MSYSDLYFQKQSTPSRYIVIAALVLVAVSVLLYFSSGVKFTRASKQTLAQHHVSNMLPSQASVFWEVNGEDQGWVIYGENPAKLEKVSFDERDRGGKTNRKYHFVVLKNLKPDTTYYYNLVSNDELISGKNNKPFSLRTLEATAAGNALSPAYGTVLYSNSKPAAGAIVLVDITNTVPLVAVTGSTGEWLVPLQYIVNIDTKRQVAITEETILTIRIFAKDGKSTIKSTVAQSTPLPKTIIIGKNYTFLSDDNVLSAQNENKNQRAKKNFSVELRYPRDNAVIPGEAPLINGLGIPGKIVTVTIDANPVFSERAHVDNKGDWRIEVRKSFKPGAYNLEMITENERGQITSIKRSFKIIKSGEQVMGESTPSGTLTPSVSVGPTGSVSPTSALSITPSVSVTLSPTPTTAEEDGETILTPTVTPAPPVSGINMLPIMVTGIGLVIIGAGLFLAL